MHRGGSSVWGRAWLVSVGVAVGLIVLDQYTKWLAETELVLGQPVNVIGTLLRWHLVYNPGAAFSIATSATWVFTLLSSAAVIGVTWFLTKPHPLAVRIAMVLLLAGAGGNLVDRLTKKPGFGEGHVVDFIALPNFAVFNVADMYITFAAVLYIATSLWPRFFGIPTDEAKENADG